MIDEELISTFCIDGTMPLVCKNPVFTEFTDEIDMLIILLSYFKQFLPQVMAKKRDCRGRNIKIDPNDIGVTVQKDFGDYIILLIPTDDNSSYADDRYTHEESEYAFQIQLEVREEDSEGALENLIKLKSGIKTMLVNMDNNLGLNTVVDTFSFDGPYSIENSKKLIRTGVYRFSVRDNKFRQPYG